VLVLPPGRPIEELDHTLEALRRADSWQHEAHSRIPLPYLGSTGLTSHDRSSSSRSTIMYSWSISVLGHKFVAPVLLVTYQWSGAPEHTIAAILLPGDAGA
jgi:hypothetical protein